MPVQFKTLFIIGVILTILASLGPLVGLGILGGLWWMYYGAKVTLLKWIVAIVVIFTAGFPALIIAMFLWTILYIGYAATGQLSNTPRETQQATEVDGTIIEAEWSEVRHA